MLIRNENKYLRLSVLERELLLLSISFPSHRLPFPTLLRLSGADVAANAPVKESARTEGRECNRLDNNPNFDRQNRVSDPISCGCESVFAKDNLI